MRGLFHFAILAILSGCATWGQMDAGLSGLQGRGIDEAIRLMGYPSSERTIAGRRIYSWTSSSSGTLLLPQTNYSQGTVYTSGVSANYYSTTTSTAAVPVNYQCAIHLEVSDGNTIVGYQYEGNLGGCHRYISALRPVAKKEPDLDLMRDEKLPFGGVAEGDFYKPKSAANELSPDGRLLPLAKKKTDNAMKIHTDCVQEESERLAMNGSGTPEADAELAVLLCFEHAESYELAAYEEARVSGVSDAPKIARMLRDDLGNTGKIFSRHIIETARNRK